MTVPPVLLSVNVGLPKNVAWQGRTVYTGVWKHPVDGPAMVRRLNIDGDGQGDTNGHGGEQRAVLVYQIESYQHWQQYFGRDDFGYGQFGENLTVDGLTDDEVCIGDRYRIGEAEFEVTQPRVTCYRVGLRVGEPELPALLVSHHRPGFYMRVLREGRVRAGDRIVRTRTGPGALSVADTDALLYLPGRDPARLRVAVNIPALSPGWRQSFRDLLADGGPAAAPAWAGFRPLRVTKVVPESANVSSIYLAGADGGPLPAARPGQYLTLRVTGAGQPAPVRSYSLSSAPGAGAYRISVKREPHGAASRYLSDRLRPGATLDVAAPRGDFVLAAAPGRCCSSRPASALPRSWPCCTSSRRPAANATSGGSTALAGRGNIRWPPRHTPCSPGCRTPASTCSTARPADASARTSSSPWTCRPTRAPTSAGRPRS